MTYSRFLALLALLFYGSSLVGRGTASSTQPPSADPQSPSTPVLALPPLALAQTSAAAASAAAQAAGGPARAQRDRSDRALLDTYCVTCHNARLQTAGLQLDTPDVGRPDLDPRLWERVVRVLRTNAMPPAGRPRPVAAEQDRFASGLETALDRVALSRPHAGRATVHRLNRTEYVNAVRDLFGLEIDGRALLPGDNTDVHGFDNNAEILSVSPVLMERYLAAARRISALVVGRPAAPDFSQYRVHKWMNQDGRMGEELPFGSRGGVAVPDYVPADGEYVVKLLLHRTTNDHIKGLGAEHLLDVRLDDALVKRFTVGGEQWAKLAPPENYSSNIRMSEEWEDYSHNMDRTLEVRFPAKAGRRTVGVAFVSGAWSPEGVIQPQAGVSLNRNEIPDGNPAVASVAISGPFPFADRTATAARPSTDGRPIFTCRPARPADEEVCARTILSRLARRAYRRPVSETDLAPLLAFYRTGRGEGSFEAGVQFALERLLVSPAFLFRLEQDPPARAAASRISDVELASRLSFFLWSSIPDDQLLGLAERGQLRDPAVLERQVRRMLADGRARSLVDNFVGQWLAVRNLREVVPDSDQFPQFDENLREAFQQETELFITSQLQEDQPLPTLLDARYTYVNERLARHYRIPNVYGTQFRRVAVTDSRRQGLLGHGSILTVTSYPNRTSPVLRGKWLLDNFLGAPPPAPPADIPPLAENTSASAARSVRERLSEHRRNPACATCHARMDPLGFALEPFDAIGGWRDTEIGAPAVGDATPPGGIPPQAPIDASATMPDGATFNGPAGLRAYLLTHRDQFTHTVVEKLLTFALGRDLDHRDAPAVRQILRGAAARDSRWSAVILGIVTSTPFQMRSAQS
jgi:cytochrome c553